MPRKWVAPELYLEYFGVRIFHAYDDDNYEDPLNNWFTTCNTDGGDDWQFDVRDLGELSEVNLALGRGEFVDTDDAIKGAIKRAIELQVLDLPAEDDVEYPFKRGSFNWYVNHPGIFIRYLSNAMLHVDANNRSRINEIYHHMITSSTVGNWDKVCDGDVVDEPITFDARASIKIADGVYYGCFFWYLNRSGSFVTHMAHAIQYADKKNLELIRQVYPQMIAAYECEDWNTKPEGFAPEYNAGAD